MDLICGKTKPTSVSILYDGIELAHMEEYQIARLGVGRKLQVPSVFKQITVRENLEVARCKYVGVFTNVVRSGQSIMTDKIENLVEFVGLYNELEKHAATIYHGQTK